MQPLSKLKIICRNPNSRSKADPKIQLATCSQRTMEAECQTEQFSKQSSKSLYKQRYQQCEQRLSQENQYLRQFIVGLNAKMVTVEQQSEKLRNSRARSVQQRDALIAQLTTQEQHQTLKQKELIGLIDSLRFQHADKVQHLTDLVNQFKELLSAKEKTLFDSKQTFAIFSEDVRRLTQENNRLKQRLHQLSKSRPITSDRNNYKPQNRRAKSTFGLATHRESIGTDSPHQVSPKEAARMGVLLQEFAQIKTSLVQGHLDSVTAFRLTTLIQYLKQTLNRKNVQILELKQMQRGGVQSDLTVENIVEKYEKMLFQNKSDIQGLECEIRILKDQKNESRQFGRSWDITKLRDSRNDYRGDSRNSSRHNSGKKAGVTPGLVGFMDGFDRTCRQKQNQYRIQQRMSSTQNISYRQIAKRQLIQKMDVTSTIFHDIGLTRGPKGSLTDRRQNSGNHANNQRYNYTYSNKCGLTEYLGRELSLKAYMTLVVKITELVDKTIKNNNNRLITAEDVLVLTCESDCPQSIRIKCELKTTELQLEVPEEYVSPDGGKGQSGVMWSLGVVFKKIYQSMEPQDQEEQDLLENIVRPQFQRILDSLLVQDSNDRINMGQFKTMLTKLS